LCVLAVRHLRTILSLVLTNSEVRKLLSDFSLIGRDLLARGASKATDSLRPDQEALAHVDETAPQDQFITEGGRKVGPTETPVPEAKVPGVDHTVAQHPKDDLGTGATVKTANGEVKSGQQMYEEGRSQAQGVKANGVGAAQEQIDDIQQYGFRSLLSTPWLLTTVLVTGKSMATILKLRSEA
jgi:hypothetical protein